MKLSIPKSRKFPHTPSERWAIKDHGANFKIEGWHLFTYKTGHVMRFAVKDHAFEVYFTQSGRHVHIFPVGKNGVIQDDRLQVKKQKGKVIAAEVTV